MNLKLSPKALLSILNLNLLKQKLKLDEGQDVHIEIEDKLTISVLKITSGK